MPDLGGLGKIVDFVNQLTDFFQSIPRRVNNLGDGFNNIFNGIGSEFVGLGLGLSLGFGDIITLIEYTFEFIKTYIMCGVHFLTNIRQCIFYYLLEALGQMLYLPFRIILWVLKMFGLNLYPAVDKSWSFIDYLDECIFKFGGFHIVHYPKNIRQLCYVCKRLKVNVLTNKATDVNTDFKERIPEMLKRGINTINKGKRQLDDVIK